MAYLLHHEEFMQSFRLPLVLLKDKTKSNYLPNRWSDVSKETTGHIKDIITFLAELFS